MIKPEVFRSSVALFVAGLVALTQCLKQKDFFVEYSYCTFIVITFYGLLGMLVFGSRTPRSDLQDWHAKAKILVNTLAIPCYTVDIWLKHGILQQQTVVWLFTVLGCVPALACALDEFSDSLFVDGLIYGYCTTTSAIACQNGNFFSILATTCFMTGFHVHRREKRIFGRFPETTFNLFMAAFVVCATASLKAPRK